MTTLITILKAVTNCIAIAVIVLILVAIITIASFGITFGARSGWRLSEQYIERQNIEHVEESLRETTVNP